MEQVPPTSYPRQRGTPVETYPIQGSKTSPFYPPVAIRSHWDPTMVYKLTVPGQHVGLPVGFRPWTRICMEYKTTGPVERLPQVPDSVVFPSGGEAGRVPPQRWSEHIDQDSLTRRLDRPLGTCETKQYEPSRTGDLFQQRTLIPDRRQPTTQFINELAMPQALLRTGPYDCREQVDTMNMDKSTRLFNNATKQDRYTSKDTTKFHKLEPKTNAEKLAAAAVAADQAVSDEKLAVAKAAAAARAAAALPNPPVVHPVMNLQQPSQRSVYQNAPMTAAERTAAANAQATAARAIAANQAAATASVKRAFPTKNFSDF